MAVPFQFESVLHHVAQVLEIGADRPELLRELVLEAEQDVDAQFLPLLEQLSLSLGEYLIQLQIRPTEIWRLSHQNRFVLQLEEGHIVLIEAHKNKLCVHQWRDETYQAQHMTRRQLKAFLGPEPRSVLSLTHKPFAPKASKTTPRQRLISFLSLESRELLSLIHI